MTTTAAHGVSQHYILEFLYLQLNTCKVFTLQLEVQKGCLNQNNKKIATLSYPSIKCDKFI